MEGNRTISQHSLMFAIARTETAIYAIFAYKIR